MLAALAERFGPAMLTPDGALDRAALAAVVFPDPEALADLNKIVHPAVRREIRRQAEEHRGTDDIVVLDIPLLTAARHYHVAGVIVVDTPQEVAVERLVRVPRPARGRRPGPHRPADRRGRSGWRSPTG